MKKGEKVKILLFTDSIKLSSEELAAIVNCVGSPVLQLQLIPANLYKISSKGGGFEAPSIHTIDSFSLKIENSVDGNKAVHVSFLVKVDFELPMKSYFAVIVKTENAIPLFAFKTLKKMSKESFILPYPFSYVPAEPKISLPCSHSVLFNDVFTRCF